MKSQRFNDHRYSNNNIRGKIPKIIEKLKSLFLINISKKSFSQVLGNINFPNSLWYEWKGQISYLQQMAR